MASGGGDAAWGGGEEDIMRIFRVCDCGDPIHYTSEHHEGEARYIFQHGYQCRLVRQPEIEAAGYSSLEEVGDKLVLPWLRSLEGAHNYEPFPAEQRGR
jgi:hypothetical protein